MANQGAISMPGVFGGLMRYNEEYKSKIMIKPVYAIAAIIIVAIAMVLLRFFIPVTA